MWDTALQGVVLPPLKEVALERRIMNGQLSSTQPRMVFMYNYTRMTR